MEKSRNIVVAVGALVLIFIGWIGWITFKSPIGPETAEIQLPQGEMAQLRTDLSEFITESLKKERPKSELLNISLDLPTEEDGKIKFPYLLSFKDGAAGAESTIRAVALLERSGKLWKVIKVFPQKETITYDQNAVVNAGSGLSSGDEKPSKNP
jgi:hypothetical protein